MSAAWSQSSGGAAQTSGTGAAQVAADNTWNVTIYFSARDPDGHIVTDLKAGELRLRVDGKPQDVEKFLGPKDAAPLTLDLLLDASGSMQWFADTGLQQKYAYSFFVSLLWPGDLADVREFEIDSQILASASGDPKALAEAVAREREPHGRTALFSALVGACQSDFDGADGRRKAILLISDGGNNYGTASERSVEDCLRKADVAIYAIAVGDLFRSSDRVPEEAWMGIPLLWRLARASGGNVWAAYAKPGTEFERALTDVVDQIHAQFTIKFAGPAPKPNGKPHKIELTTTRKGIVLFAPRDMPDGAPINPSD